ncbi:MAG: hypothetical protein CMJ68_19875 [Planctomycetaceae bacterium]|nr:hypothetical protein [Planctomycetaceae bacterium]
MFFSANFAEKTLSGPRLESIVDHQLVDHYRASLVLTGAGELRLATWQTPPTGETPRKTPFLGSKRL